ncbi:hypothetical protein P8452_43201 [Trifolium repens]|nr:hypothetical protein P8452_43201 [Trifolium repens]
MNLKSRLYLLDTRINLTIELRHPTLFLLLLLHAQPSAFSAVPVSNATVAASVVSILQTPVHRLWEDEGLCCTNNHWGKSEQMKKTDFSSGLQRSENRLSRQGITAML